MKNRVSFFLTALSIICSVASQDIPQRQSGFPESSSATLEITGTAVSGTRWRRGLSERVVMTKHFTERTLTPGGDTSMQCAASSDRPPQFSWERDGVPVSANTDSRYALGQLMTSDNSVVSQLNITRVRVEDGGLYSCIAREGDDVATHENRLDVYGPPYIRALPPIKVQSGESVNLRCPYYGYPISKIDWEFKGKIVNSNIFQTRYKRTYKNHKAKRNVPSVNINGILTISEVDKEHNGAIYTCVVTSPSGEMARRAFEIQVIEGPVLEELLLGTNVQEGQIVNIYCNVKSGDLPIHFEWLKDGKRIPSNLKVTERKLELFSALIIKKVSLEHCGVYTCVASNHVAKTNRSTELYIKVAPKWSEEPTNSSLLIGRRGTVTCSAIGYPQPQVHWMKKDAVLGTWQPVLELAVGGILSLPNGTLLIEEVSLSDEGIYSCNVENGVGQPLSKTIWMSVNKPVYFESSSVNITSQIGHAITLECRPMGDDPIRIIWTHYGNPLTFENHRYNLQESKIPQGLISSVSVQYAEIQDAGVYQCTASNPFGNAAFNIYLTVLEPPIPPTELHVFSQSSSTAKISWHGMSASNFILQYTPRNFAGWDHNYTINITSKESGSRQVAELKNLRPATSYAVRVASVNQVGVSQFTGPVHFTTYEEAPSLPPLNLHVEQTANPGELRISWLPPPLENHNGVIIGYYVKAGPQIQVNVEVDTKIVKISPQAGKQETVLSGLLKNTRYAVSVSAITSGGTGPYSSPVFQDTREGAPEKAPTSVECSAVGSTSLRVGWQPVTSAAGYTVLYASEDGPWQNMSSQATEVYLQGLLKYTNYSVKVAAYSNFGVGPYSFPIDCATLEDVPGPPAAIKVLGLSPTSMLVSWKEPEEPNGEIIYYMVYVKPTGSVGSAQSVRAAGAARRAEVARLAAGATYEVSARAATRAGRGPATAPSLHTAAHRVVAGVASLGGVVAVGAGRSALLPCVCVGVPPPRTVWYHQHNIITHHPRFTRNHDDSLLINNIDQSLSGNYSCLAKNLYGSDSVEYTVVVLPLPEAPLLRATPYRRSLLVQWQRPRPSRAPRTSYSLTWKESESTDPWQEVLSPLNEEQYLLTDLKCGTKYSLRITATNKVGTSQPAYLDVSTLGGVPIPPQSSEWLWSNSSVISIATAGWQDGGCAITSWTVEYRKLGTSGWIKEVFPGGSRALAVSAAAGAWYQLRVSAASDAGRAAAAYTRATTDPHGHEIGPPSDTWDVNMLVIICSSFLLIICLISCVYILVKRHRFGELPSYQESVALDNKSSSGNLTANTSHTNLAKEPPNNQHRIYSAPLHTRNTSKHELYEISPYAQFAVGFRTFGHVENQDVPRFKHSQNDTETSFQVCSESEDSDSISKSTLKSVPRKVCRTPHHR